MRARWTRFLAAEMESATLWAAGLWRLAGRNTARRKRESVCTVRVKFYTNWLAVGRKCYVIRRQWIEKACASEAALQRSAALEVWIAHGKVHYQCCAGTITAKCVRIFTLQMGRNVMYSKRMRVAGHSCRDIAMRCESEAVLPRSVALKM